ncbi:MAG: phosphoribosylformylglycinamidine cyclo-ligase [Oscillospiraceae bacterium]|nr:phosphoribosylformylglycinamidine cyclo-ligase [Oscillospiraceae bacterium]
MQESYSKAYADAGVDVTAGYKAVELMKSHIVRTEIPGVLGKFGGFGGMFAPNLRGISEPVLVSGTDGVGTKLKIAFAMNKHDTIGIDCVAMCANDVACSGAKPLFFLDYLAVPKTIPETVEKIISGVAEGCVQAGCALVGGETAEMPGLYSPGEYDLAGFCVGLADKSKITDCSKIREGDVLIGVQSSGVHSNGFSLIRKALDITPERLALHVDDLGQTLGEELLTPTKIYVKALLALFEEVAPTGISHITGGGFYENIPRMLPEGKRARVEKSALPKMPIFGILQNTGIPERDMFNTFNMGIGLVLSVDKNHADKAIAVINTAGETAHIIGEVTSGEQGIDICG